MTRLKLPLLVLAFSATMFNSCDSYEYNEDRWDDFAEEVNTALDDNSHTEDIETAKDIESITSEVGNPAISIDSRTALIPQQIPPEMYLSLDEAAMHQSTHEDANGILVVTVNANRIKEEYTYDAGAALSAALGVLESTPGLSNIEMSEIEEFELSGYKGKFRNGSVYFGNQEMNFEIFAVGKDKVSWQLFIQYSEGRKAEALAILNSARIAHSE
ncbi:MAG: hypothetical protein ACI9J3_000991 [Parvicellaceae bacterium]|jgi:hypothetical protein